MALIMYLTKAPRYKNIMTNEYETISKNDIGLIDKYFSWGMAREDGGRYSCDTLEEWCGIPESQLPHKYIVNYYRDFFTEKNAYREMIGECKRYTIFEHLARIVKANQIFEWFIKNVMNGEINKEYYDISKEQLTELLYTCKQVVSEGVVKENEAKEMLPLMENTGYFFGTSEYNNIYAIQVTDMIKILENVLSTTDFEKEAVYFNATW